MVGDRMEDTMGELMMETLSPVISSINGNWMMQQVMSGKRVELRRSGRVDTVWSHKRGRGGG